MSTLEDLHLKSTGDGQDREATEDEESQLPAIDEADGDSDGHGYDGLHDGADAHSGGLRRRRRMVET